MFALQSRDAVLLLLSRTFRAYGYGFVAILLGLYLGNQPPAGLGLPAWQVGLFLTATLASSAALSAIVGLQGDRLGRRLVLKASALAMALAGALFALSTDIYILLLAAILGTISPTGGEVGPFLSLEQAMLPQTVPVNRRNDAFAFYNLVGSLAAAAGALSAGIPDLLTSLGWDPGVATRLMFAVYSLLALATFLAYSRMSPAVELGSSKGLPVRMSPEGRRWVTRLAGLFALDSFAGGFVITSFVAYWFFLTFGTPRAILAQVFFVASILTGLSYLVAVRLARRIGLLRTMVFTHIPSSVFLILVPLMPNFALALGFYLARMSLSQMDVPTRQAYVVAIMAPGDRTAATSFTNIARNSAQAVSPSLSGLLLSLSTALPFVLGGLLKIAYDLALFRTFKDIRPPDEVQAPAATAPPPPEVSEEGAGPQR